ncbi:MAG: hypothetical protein ACNYPE_12065 [Candidatus Azotimanducaceae bacterium WSBS_2022_MAG_OTU7]
MAGRASNDAVPLMFQTVQQSGWQALPECERDEYLPLSRAGEVQKAAWMNSIRLDKAHEPGRILRNPLATYWRSGREPVP